MPVATVVGVFGVGILVFSAVWANVARARGYDEAVLAWVDLMIYALAGFVAAKAGGLGAGALAGTGVAAIEVTIGWWLHDTVWARRPRPKETVIKKLLIIILVLNLGFVFGFAGAVLSGLLFV